MNEPQTREILNAIFSLKFVMGCEIRYERASYKRYLNAIKIVNAIFLKFAWEIKWNWTRQINFQVIEGKFEISQKIYLME